MFTKLSAAFLIVAMLFVIGCASHVHTVGNGSQSGNVTQARQWYAAWGLVPLNDVDTNAMAGGARDYEIMTSYTIIDSIINTLTGNFISVRTVTVEK